LGVALKLGAYISQSLPEVGVIYTRQTDKFVPLDERSEIANTQEADVFISIHVNSSEAKAVTGASTWSMGLHMSEDNMEIAQRENSAMKLEENHHTKYDGFDPESPESYIILNLMQNTYMEQSLMLSTKIQLELKQKVGLKDRGVKQAGFVVLWKTTMPAVLVEIGFISNAKEEKFLASANGQDLIASAIFRAFRTYKANIEQKTVGRARIQVTTAEKVDKKAIAQEKPTKSGIWFCVQLVVSSTQISLSDPIFKGIKGVYELQQDGVYKYYIGKLPRYEDLKNLKASVAGKFKDIFSVAFENGTRIDIKQAIEKSKKN
jgi:N-acetylmuramoyl-L-alanine amidase